MIIDLPDTTTSQVAKSLVKAREDGGVVALGRVLTLIIASPDDSVEAAIDAANDASREHPMRVIVLTTSTGEARLDAQIRVGGDAGASEVVVLHAYGDAASNEESLITGLLLPDAPVVVWWPTEAPEAPAESPLGRIAQRRITDAATAVNVRAQLEVLGRTHVPGDTDLAWTRLTHWREQLAAVLDQPPFEEVTSVEVRGSAASPSTALLASWLGLALDVPVRWAYEEPQHWAHGIKSVRLSRASGDILLERPVPGSALLTQPGQPDHELHLPRRTLRECLAEELRRLDPDLLYGRVITDGWEQLSAPEPAA
ncbi:glucose-6-phosphate dehydrogenase assembly protein OpcA [Microbacterium panaciterrae]|uniref:Glucose-6-phosphate dehydrogenase assembly protein OpcA n=1 Tax=Microbacterium panaciterrae TaxID=985759 RepID=A0ABP8P4B9_9MICO